MNLLVCRPDLFRLWDLQLEPHHTLLNALFTADATLEVVKELIDNDITLLEERDYKDRGPVELCSTFARFELERLLLSYASSKAEVICLGEKVVFGACAKGHLESVQMLYERHGEAINNFPSEDISPIAAASEYGHLDVVEFLNALGQGEPEEDGRYDEFNLRWIFEYEPSSFEILDFALSSPRRVAAIKRDYDRTIHEVLLDAAKSGPDGLCWLLKSENAIKHFDAVTFIRNHADHVAWPVVSKIDPRMLHILVNLAGINLRTVKFPQLSTGSFFTVALGIWLRNPHDEECKEAFMFLGSLGFDANVRVSCRGISPNPSMIDGSDGRLDRPSEDDGLPMITPLLMAASYGNLEAVQLLVEFGAKDLDPESAGDPGSSALYHAIHASKTDGEDAAVWILNAMEERGSLFKVVSSRLVLACFHFGAPTVASLLLRKFPRLAEQPVDSMSVTMLDIALRSNQVETVKWMLSDPTLPFRWSTHYTPSTFAICLGKKHLDAVNFIWESKSEIGNDISLETYDLPSGNLSTLTLALGLDDTTLAKTLFHEIAAKAPEKLSASFPMALTQDREDVVALYATHNAIDWSVLNGEGANWLHQVILLANAEERMGCINTLIASAGPTNLEKCDKEGDTPLMTAILLGKTRIISALLQAGASIHFNETPAHFEFYERLATSSDPSVPNSLTMTPIHYALYGRRFPVLRLIFDECGPSAFHLSHVNAFILNMGLLATKFFVEEIFPDYLPKADSHAESTTFDDKTTKRVRSMFFSAVNAKNWTVIHYLAIERKFASLAPEYYYPDLRMEFGCSSSMWEELYDVEILGKCINASIGDLELLKENDPWASTMPPMIITPCYNIGTYGSLPLIKAMYSRGANFARQSEYVRPFLLNLFSLPAIKWLMSKGFHYFLNETTDGDHPNFDAMRVSPGIKRALLCLPNM